ncbi:hypothetical protein CC1G_08540 [Coprinopsis cinerea okayama7|uniref:Uncharacterized protein n=1 Tax=Coprinopsis cinerea (strain Okayama-7 / 130 / ATCC MYA-4618 / FGSC 9003) TaxID=240176 RepID=A8ND66_COPC7|nr:hypothetical protein CC1G_08540 [Coprinopsis cinerea okayama7\|eukprot:XP_001832712.1 hypothetical protein CC1G_08540 [Coprinopsis cinerea okayama7\
MSYIERKAWDLNTRMLAEEAKALSESHSSTDSEDASADDNYNDAANSECGSFSDSTPSGIGGESDSNHDTSSIGGNSETDESDRGEVTDSDANASYHSSSDRHEPPYFDICSAQHTSTPTATESRSCSPSTTGEIIPPSTEREVYMAMQSSPLSHLRSRPRGASRRALFSSSTYSDGHPSEYSPSPSNQSRCTATQSERSFSDHSVSPVQSILDVEGPSYTPHTTTAAPWTWEIRLKMYHLDTELQTVDVSREMALQQFEAYRRSLQAQQERYRRLLVEGPEAHPLESSI